MLDSDRLTSGSRALRAIAFTLLLALVFRVLDPPQPTTRTSFLMQSVAPTISAFLSQV